MVVGGDRHHASTSVVPAGEQHRGDLVGDGVERRAAHHLGRARPGQLDRDARRRSSPDGATSRRSRRPAAPPRRSSGSRAGSSSTRSIQIRCSSMFIRRRVISSRAPNGSSSSSTFGSVTSARAMATRWRIPPDSWLGPGLGEALQPDQLEQVVDPGPIVRRPDGLQGEADVVGDVAPRQQRRVLEGDPDLVGGADRATAVRRARAPSRSSACSRSAMIRRTVDLPQPDGPTSAVRLPDGATWSTRSTATSGLAAERELLAQSDQLDPGVAVAVVNAPSAPSRGRGRPRRRCRRGRTGTARRRRRAGRRRARGRQAARPRRRRCRRARSPGRRPR